MAPHHDRRIVLLALIGAAPAVLFALFFVWHGDHPPRVQWTVTALVLLGVWLTTLAQRERIIRPLQTISNILAALREGDFSLRARGADPEDSLGLALLEANLLGETLRQQRLGALEATALLRGVMAEIDVAVFTFGADRRLRLVNRAGERLLALPSERLLGRDAVELGLAECLEGEAPRIVERSGAAGPTRWELRRTTFRQDGREHYLLVLADLSRTLQAEERVAWQRLVRVLSHEINNSLAPIKSLAGSLRHVLTRGPRAPDAEEDLQQGLSVIEARAEALGRFMASYARLARLPRPTLLPLEVSAWVRRVAGLETRRPIRLHPGPDLSLLADGDQLDQALINLVGNAVDAVGDSGGAVTVGWQRAGYWLDVLVEDEGTGIADTANLFVPFYTTKPGGSGIGLALSRQIAEAHGGTLTLENRTDRRGCRARLRLPLTSPTTPLFPPPGNGRAEP